MQTTVCWKAETFLLGWNNKKQTYLYVEMYGLLLRKSMLMFTKKIVCISSAQFVLVG